MIIIIKGRKKTSDKAEEGEPYMIQRKEMTLQR